MRAAYHVSLNEGSLTYEKIVYPMGEQQIRMRKLEIDHVKRADVIRVTALGVPDVMDIALLNDALVGINRDAHYSLVLPYLPYSRADRRFVEGDCSGLAVFGQLLNTMKWDAVATLDVHNFVAANAYIKNFINISPRTFIEYAICKLGRMAKTRHVTILYPDKGAQDRYAELDFGLVGSNVEAWTTNVAVGEKDRDPATGELKGFKIPINELTEATLIVDDICDGGGTFAGIGAMIPDLPSLGLYVTHGIFSKGFKPLERFKRIFCTSSTGKNWSHENVHTSHCEFTIFEALRNMLPKEHIKGVSF